jgi:ubiquinone/menaquinone biosynthesis C-methylase UbiE
MAIERLREEFDRWARTYDETVRSESWGFEEYDRILDRVVEVSRAGPGSRVLEIGVGTGNLSARFLAAGAVLLGVEPSVQMRRVASEKLPGLALVDGHFEDLSRVQGEFDAAASTYALHHVPDAVKRSVLAKLVGLLRPGGRLVIADLAFRDAVAREQTRRAFLERGLRERWAEVEEEHWADLDQVTPVFEDLAAYVQVEQLTGLVWLVLAVRRE